jgi:MFS family permease
MRYLRVKSYDFAVMTGLILMPSFQLDMTGIDENTNGIMISSLLAGAIAGAIFSGPLADALGRKALMALGTVIFIFGNILQVGAEDLKRMYGGRAITGVSIGYTMMLLVYIILILHRMITMAVPLCIYDLM